MNQEFRIMFGTVHPNQYAIKYGVEKNIERTSDTLIGYLPIFQMLPKTYHWYPFNRMLDVLGTN